MPEPARGGRAPQLPIVDRFTGPVARGRVVGSPLGAAGVRQGADPHRTLSIDPSGLRVAPLERPGWGRSTLSYGPVPVVPGLVMVAHVLNGHQAAQTYALRRLSPRLRQWIEGSGTRRGARRLVRLAIDRRRLSSLRRIRGWARMTRAADSPLARRLPALARRRARRERDETVLDNLVVGLLAGPVANSPADIASGYVVRSADSRSGELRVLVAGEAVPAIDRLAGLPFHLAVICRADSVLYAVASLAGARGMPGHPRFRPLAVGPLPPAAPVHPAVQQNVSGEIGFSVDTRVLGVAVAEVSGCGAWSYGAHLADHFVGDGPVGGTSSVTGPVWTAVGHRFDRAASGAVATPGAGVAADPGAPTGLLRLALGGGPAAVAVLWRSAGPANHWRLELARSGFRLGYRLDGTDHWLETGSLSGMPAEVQVLDDGLVVRVLADAAVLAVVEVEADGAPATGVGLEALAEGAVGLVRFEAHPREIELPPVVDLGPASDLRSQAEVLLTDDFTAPAGTPLEGRPVTPEGPAWSRSLGTGRLVIDEPGRVLVESCSDRTALTLPWTAGPVADLTARIVPRHRPGAQSRAGLIAMQDGENYLCINLWFNDRDDGAASVSSFLTLDGHEDVYDAVWVNVFDRVGWDRPVDLGLLFDGRLYQVSLDGEPVLWRRLDDVYPGAAALRTTRVGLLANWEWGFDTGSHIQRFTARRHPVV